MNYLVTIYANNFPICPKFKNSIPIKCRKAIVFPKFYMNMKSISV